MKLKNETFGDSICVGWVSPRVALASEWTIRFPYRQQNNNGFPEVATLVVVTEIEKPKWGMDLNLVKMVEDEQVEARSDIEEKDEASRIGTAIFKNCLNQVRVCVYNLMR